MNCLYPLLNSLFMRALPRILVSQTIIFLISTLVDKPLLVDVSWGFCHFLIGLTIYQMSMKYNILVLSLLTLWFVRLSGFLFYYRVIKPYIDYRYEKLFSNKNKILLYFMNFHGMGFMTLFTSIPLYYALQNELTLYNYVGLALSTIALYFHHISDMQIQRFKNTRTDRKTVFRGGFYKNCRHPNLFFDLVFWIGLAIAGLNMKDTCSYLGFLGPISLWAGMNFMTTKITQKHMLEDKENYAKVIQETYKFLPL